MLVLSGFSALMVQPTKFLIYTFAICGALICAAPAPAQIGPIYQEEAPRPPADVPGASRQHSLPGQIGPQQIPGPPDYRRPLPRPPADISKETIPDESDDTADEPDSDVPDDEPNDVTPNQPGAVPMRMPPSARPPGRTIEPQSIESQDLAPPPGITPAIINPSGVGPRPMEQDSPSLSLGQPPGVRPSAGVPQRPNPEANPSVPTDTVVVAPPPMRIPNPTAVFAGLDKITGRIISFDVAINETVQFGALQVTPRACYSRPPTERANTDAFIEIDEVTLKGETKRIFTGWMFAASPGLHAIEHPIYDVWLTDCKGGQNSTITERVNDQNEARKPGPRVTPQPIPRPQPSAQRGTLPPR